MSPVSKLKLNPPPINLSLGEFGALGGAGDFPHAEAQKLFPGLVIEFTERVPSALPLAFTPPLQPLDAGTALARAVFGKLQSLEEIAWYEVTPERKVDYTSSQLRYTIETSYGDSFGEQEYFQLSRYDYNSKLRVETKISAQVPEMFDGAGDPSDYFSFVEAAEAARQDLLNFRNYHELTWWENPQRRYAYTHPRPTTRGPLNYYINNTKRHEPVRVERICDTQITVLGNYVDPWRGFARAEKDFAQEYIKLMRPRG